MANTIKIKRGLSANLSKANLQDGELAFTTDTKELYISNTDEPVNKNTTYAISKSGSTITLTGSDGSTSTVSDSNTTYSDATTSAAGLMTAAMVTKLNGIATGANKTTVDTSLSSSSTNPVQNKVIYNALAGKAATSAIPTKTSQLTNDSGYLTEHQDISGKENILNKVTTITSSSTSTQYPSAKAVYDLFNSITNGDEVSY